MKSDKYHPKFFRQEPTREEYMQNENAKLRAAVARLQHEVEGLKHNEGQQRKILESRRDQIKKLVPDADRYRQLRDMDNVFVLDGEAINLKGAALDKYLDKSMRATWPMVSQSIVTILKQTP